MGKDLGISAYKLLCRTPSLLPWGSMSLEMEANGYNNVPEGLVH